MQRRILHQFTKTSMYSALSLDLGATTGWAYIQDGYIRYSGELDHSLGKYQRKGQNLNKFMSFLENFESVDEIFYEDVNFIRHRGHAASFFAFEAVLMMFVSKFNIKQYSLTPEEWKKILTGQSRSSEKGMEKFRICSKLHSLGWRNGKRGTDKNNNEADACGLAFAVHKLRGWELQFQKVLDK